MARRSWEELAQLLADCDQAEATVYWARADLCREAHEEHGAKWSAIAEAAGCSASQVRLLAGLAARVPEEHRHSTLSPGVWAVLAKTADPTAFCCRLADGGSIAEAKEMVGADAAPSDEAIAARAARAAERFVTRARDEYGAQAVAVKVVVGDGEEVQRAWPK